MSSILKRYCLKTLIFSLLGTFFLIYGHEQQLYAQDILYAQDTLHLSFDQVIKRGLDSNKTLHLSQSKIDETLAQYEQARDARLPEIKASFSPSEAFILTRTLQIDGLTKDPIHLPAKTTLYLGTLSANETIFAGHRIRIASKSADLLHEIAKLNTATDSQEIILDLMKAYINLFKIDQGLKITQQELVDIQRRLEETIKFKNQELATDNDVLRFKLQKAKAQLNQIDFENNRDVANYTLCLLLGIHQDTYLKVDSVGAQAKVFAGLPTLVVIALAHRKELAVYQYKNQLSSLNIKKIKGEKLPTLGIGANGYYINPNSQFIPPNNSFLVPITFGLNLGWNISSLYKSKHKIAEATIQKKQVKIAESAIIDRIKNEVNKQYLDYSKAGQKISVLETAVRQSRENDRIMELKYRNQLATTTDRIDAQTMLYQSLLNLSIAKADAVGAYFRLLKATGTLTVQSDLNN